MDSEVVIVGAGPTGLMLAYELALAGVQPIVADLHPERRQDAPGLAINSTVVELLTRRGLMDALQGDGVSVPIAHFSHLWLTPAALPQHPYTFGLIQALLELRLIEALSQRGVEIRWGHRLTGLSQDAGQVTAQLDTPEGPATLTCRYLVGCDGADSTVRQRAGIEFPGEHYPFSGITGDLLVAPGSNLFSVLGPDWHPRGAFTAVPAGPAAIKGLTAMFTDPGAKLSEPLAMRVLVGEFDREAPDPQAPPTLAEVHEYAQRITGLDLELGEPLWLRRWGYSRRHATDYRAGRVFVAGDAAHVHFPLGGQAISTGVEDAVNLGWKLAAVLDGSAPESLLDTYQSERHPVGARACLTTQAQAALLHPWEKVLPLRQVLQELIKIPEVDEYLLKLAAALDVRYQVSYPGLADDGAHPLLGWRLPAIPVTTAEGQTDLARLQHAGGGLLLDMSGGTLDTAGIQGWAGSVTHVVLEPTPDLDAAVVLLRPDGRVAWADQSGKDADGLRTALTTWFGPREPGQPAIRR
jgi:2-polyprenyl-6-methoxyphenol hydroxylase-like FAD-dependent oxidoreductase